MTDPELESTPMWTITAKMVHAGAMVLGELPEGASAKDLWAAIGQRWPHIEREYETLHQGSTPAFHHFRRACINARHAGWIYKTDQCWYLSPVGRTALREYLDPIAFYQQARWAYQAWDTHRVSHSKTVEMLANVPEGSWVAGGDLAQQVGLAEDTLLRWLQGPRPEGWHRVLDADGGLPDILRLSEDDRRRWQQLLDEDGLYLIMERAETYRRIPAVDLLALSNDPEGESGRRAWLVRGANVQGENLLRSLWLTQGLCSLPATRLADLPSGAGRDQIKAAVDRGYAHATAGERAKLTTEYHAFLTRMRIDDIVVSNSGGEYFLGVVSSPPSFVASVGGRANLQRGVVWRNTDTPVPFVELPDEIAARVGNPDAEIIELTEFLGELEALLGEQPEEAVAPRDFTLPDATPTLADALLYGQAWLQECVELLRDRPQLVFYGPPGTGKTYLAQALAEHLAGGKPENVQLVQFHPAYTYEDFFEGIRPHLTEDGQADNGQVGYRLRWGPLRRLAKAARDHPDEPFVLIIDEINRGNLAKIFGELYFLLEYRGRAVNLLYGSDKDAGFTLPRNLVLIGTMNTADRSIALVDTAMRRRFAFVELHPSEEPVSSLLHRWLAEKQLPDTAARLLTELNARINDRDFRIGPSYLMRRAIHDHPDGFTRVWRTQLLPLLEEHHYGDGTDVAAVYGLPAIRATLHLPTSADQIPGSPPDGT